MSGMGGPAERDSNSIIEGQLNERLCSIEAAADSDVLTYFGPMYAPSDDFIKDAVEAIDPRRESLLVILETPGGHVSVTERIARIFRHHYGTVDFLVPNFAMSAGTILVMSGDAIYMDYASSLGPIDPQIDNGNGFVPALGYLEQFERLVKKSEKGTLTTAELAYLMQSFDPAELYQYEQERELSIALLEEWLVKYKFKDWKETETRKKKVTDSMKKTRAKQIATKLNKTGMWHSHGRLISMEVLRRDLNILIDDFGADDDLAGPVHDYYRLLRDYVMRRDHGRIVIHSRGGYVGY